VTPSSAILILAQLIALLESGLLGVRVQKHAAMATPTALVISRLAISMEAHTAPRLKTLINATLRLAQLTALLTSGQIGDRALELVVAAKVVVAVLFALLLIMAERIALRYIKLGLAAMMIAQLTAPLANGAYGACAPRHVAVEDTDKLVQLSLALSMEAMIVLP
jgi:hypothetical protein